MQSNSNFDPKIIEEILKFSKNVIEAPKFVSAPDEISLEVTPHKVVQQISYFGYTSREKLGTKSTGARV